ncbi:MAG: hypothetical protein WC346_08450 [Methanogenium sp.]|jgi:hypothetical protein
MSIDKLRLSSVREEMLFLHRNKVKDLYKDGYSLGDICRELCLDISSVLYILRKSKLKKQTLYKIYEDQLTRNDEKQNELFSEEEKFYIDKFFPHSDSNNFSTSYFWFWRKNFKKDQEKKKHCKHQIRTIHCSICNKTLGDASNIPLPNEVIITKNDQV